MYIDIYLHILNKSRKYENQSFVKAINKSAKMCINKYNNHISNKHLNNLELSCLNISHIFLRRKVAFFYTLVWAHTSKLWT